MHGVGFNMDLDCFHCSPLSKALCCPMNPCSLPVDVGGGVGMYSYPILLIPLPYCLPVFTYSHLQCSLGHSDVYHMPVFAGNLVDHFLLLFKHLLLHFYKQLLQCTLGFKDSLTSKGCTRLLNFITEALHIHDMECLRLLFFSWWLFIYALSLGTCLGSS